MASHAELTDRPAHPVVFDVHGKPRAIPPGRVTSLMLELLELKHTDKVLEIGTGSGTQTAEFAKRCGELHTLELEPVICADYMGRNVYVHREDGIKGLPQEAPYDAIVCTCGIDLIPEAWKQQLAESGRIVAPVGTNEIQRLTLFRKRDGMVSGERVIGYVRFTQMENL